MKGSVSAGLGCRRRRGLEIKKGVGVSVVVCDGVSVGRARMAPKKRDSKMMKCVDIGVVVSAVMGFGEKREESPSWVRRRWPENATARKEESPSGV